MKTSKPDTLLVTTGRKPEENFGIVNPPVYHASTILFPSVAAFEAARHPDYPGLCYGRVGTPTTFALEEAVATLDGGDRAAILSSGLAAITTALMTYVAAGDHLLVTDSVYGPVRRFCVETLARFGVETTFYDPRVGADLADLIRPNTRAVHIESPGSFTFEVQDVPAIAAAAHAAGAKVVCDNTWATPLFFKPYDHGVDVAVYAATKYISGHSDTMLGVITTSAAAYPAIRACVTSLGHAAAPDDIYLALRGLRTMGVRLRRHRETAITLARWLQGRPEVSRVIHPALEGDAGHALWKRDFTGSSGLFGVVLKPCAKSSHDGFLEALKLFGLGASWGGYESLILPTSLAATRSAVPWDEPGRLVRIHAGLEDPADLVADLEQGLARLEPD
jgi:cystathionine beta-lyase